MLNDIVSQAKDEMERALEACKKHLVTIRTGRASVSLLDGLKVDYYGTPTLLSQVATLHAVDARLLTVKPWEKAMLKPIEKAITDANLGVNPVSDGEIVRVPVPPLTEERRREYAKLAKKRCEDSKVVVRNSRRDANELLKDATKESSISEDDEKRGLKMVQDITDEYIVKLDHLYEKKEQEIMTV